MRPPCATVHTSYRRRKTMKSVSYLAAQLSISSGYGLEQRAKIWLGIGGRSVMKLRTGTG